MVKSIFLYLQYRYRSTIAMAALNQIITSVGMAIYLPKTPEVLINNVAKSNPEIFFKCAFSIKFYSEHVALFLQNQFL